MPQPPAPAQPWPQGLCGQKEDSAQASEGKRGPAPQRGCQPAAHCTPARWRGVPRALPAFAGGGAGGGVSGRWAPPPPSVAPRLGGPERNLRVQQVEPFSSWGPALWHPVPTTPAPAWGPPAGRLSSSGWREAGASTAPRGQAVSCKADGHHGPSSDQPGDLAPEAAAGSWGRSSSGKKRTSCLNQSHIHFKCHAAWWRTSSVPAGEFSLPADGVSTCGRSGTRGRAWQGGERGHRRRWPVRLSQPRTSAPARGSVTHGGWQLHRLAHMASPIQNRSPALLPVKNPAAVAGVTAGVQVQSRAPRSELKDPA